MALLRKQLSSNFKSSRTTNIHYSKQQRLPPGAITDFVWKDYCCTLFRNIQELGDVNYEDYMLSICRHETLMELALRGGCGRPFFLPHDDRFVIKTLRKSEAKVLIEMLPGYYAHIKKYENSLLAKYYGLHAARPGCGGQKVYFVVMENLLQSDLQMQRRYDLKGSTQGRSPSKTGNQPRLTLKDLELNLCFYLDNSTRNLLLEQLKLDCKFLEENGIMDYSLLLGVYVEPPQRATTDERTFDESVTPQSKKEQPAHDDSVQAQNGRNSSVGDSLESHHRRDPTLSDFFLTANRPESRFGAKLPARVNHVTPSDKESASTSRVARLWESSSNVYLYLGIIDFLQNYNVIKRLEHAYKSLHYNPKAIPSVNPKLYATRFQDFLCKVFLSEDLNSTHSADLFPHNSNTALS